MSPPVANGRCQPAGHTAAQQSTATRPSPHPYRVWSPLPCPRHRGHMEASPRERDRLRDHRICGPLTLSLSPGGSLAKCELHGGARGPNGLEMGRPNDETPPRLSDGRLRLHKSDSHDIRGDRHVGHRAGSVEPLCRLRLGARIDALRSPTDASGVSRRAQLRDRSMPPRSIGGEVNPSPSGRRCRCTHRRMRATAL